MKFGVVIFPGSNCDRDMIYTLRETMKLEVVELWHKDTDLQGCDFIVLPGGFSYGDYLRSGAIARFSPIMEKVVEFAKEGGFVLGICNGFQVLCESGLLPGALMHNNTQSFICKNVYLKPANTASAINADLDTNRAYKIPIAHGEGRFYADEATIAELEAHDQVLFYYCDAKGEVSEASNPNGSIMNIAGVCNRNRNVFGMMPHPERAADANLGNLDGLEFFQSLVNNLAVKA